MLACCDGEETERKKSKKIIIIRCTFLIVVVSVCTMYNLLCLYVAKHKHVLLTFVAKLSVPLDKEDGSDKECICSSASAMPLFFPSASELNLTLSLLS